VKPLPRYVDVKAYLDVLGNQIDFGVDDVKDVPAAGRGRCCSCRGSGGYAWSHTAGLSTGDAGQASLSG